MSALPGPGGFPPGLLAEAQPGLDVMSAAIEGLVDAVAARHGGEVAVGFTGLALLGGLIQLAQGGDDPAALLRRWSRLLAEHIPLPPRLAAPGWPPGRPALGELVWVARDGGWHGRVVATNGLTMRVQPVGRSGAYSEECVRLELRTAPPEGPR